MGQKRIGYFEGWGQAQIVLGSTQKLVETNWDLSLNYKIIWMKIYHKADKANEET